MAPLVVTTPRSLAQFVGREVAVTEWLTVTEDRIRRFADATNDHQWIHVDSERAKTESPYGRPIAHGFLTLSLMSYFLNQAIQFQGGIKMGINYGVNRVRFPSPVLADSRVRARLAIHSMKEVPNAIEVTFSIVVECHDAPKPCCVAEWIVRYYDGE